MMSDLDIVDLAEGLRSLKWSWRLEDVPTLAEMFGWRINTSGTGWVMLDVGFGMSSGKVFGDADGRVDDIGIRLTDFADEDSAARDRIRDTFARYTSVLTVALGEPTSRRPCDVPEVRWAGSNTTLVLRGLSVSVVLHLVTNASLAIQDLPLEAEEDDDI